MRLKSSHPINPVNKEFYQALENLLQPRKLSEKNRDSYLRLIYFIERSLRQLNIYNYEVGDIISEVCLRGQKFISREPIKNPGAWIRVTSYNIICEISRIQKKEILIDSNLIESNLKLRKYENAMLEQDNQQELKMLKQALQTIKESDRKILLLRAEGLSWKEVTKYLESDEKVLQHTTVRQRGKRALEKLRKAYQLIKLKQGD